MHGALPHPPRYTGEDLVELQLHGGPAVVSAVSAALGAVDGVRPAVEGEFTRRALANGKLDLTQVEGVYDLITAETEAQRDQAVRHLTAETTELYDRWRAEILRAMAHVEAYIDFGEDEGLEDEVMQQAVAQVTGLRAEIAGYIARTRCGERLRRGVRVAVVGRPNVGKSSLMNFLCGRDAAIVADSPGTTRDVIEVAGDVGGYPVLFLDTAGVRHLPGIDPVEVEGILRGEAAAARADLRICVQDSVAGAAGLCERGWSRGGAPCQCQPDGPPSAPIIVVHNKMDLVLSSEAEARERGGGVGAVAVSCLRGTGLDALVDRLRHEVQALCGGGASALPLIQARHKRHLLDCVQGLDRVSLLLLTFPTTTTATIAILEVLWLHGGADALVAAGAERTGRRCGRGGGASCCGAFAAPSPRQQCLTRLLTTVMFTG